MKIRDSENNFIQIPNKVDGNNKLSYGARLLYGRILSLSRRFGICTAHNDYFSKHYGCTNRTIQKWLDELKKEDLIEHSIYTVNSKSKRTIKVLGFKKAVKILNKDELAEKVKNYNEKH